MPHTAAPCCLLPHCCKLAASAAACNHTPAPQGQSTVAPVLLLSRTDPRACPEPLLGPGVTLSWLSRLPRRPGRVAGSAQLLPCLRRAARAAAAARTHIRQCLTAWSWCWLASISGCSFGSFVPDGRTWRAVTRYGARQLASPVHKRPVRCPAHPPLHASKHIAYATAQQHRTSVSTPDPSSQACG